MANGRHLARIPANFLQPILKRGQRVLLAVSGGADSVALLRLCHAAMSEQIAIESAGQGMLCAAHFNHGLRGQAADADAEFVAALCATLQIPCTIGKRPDEARSQASSEATMRAERYRFLCQSARQMNARYIATAHTADDQVETVLHRILRGTGVRGLAGMRKKRRLAKDLVLVRPLLTVNKAELIDYLRQIKQTWREDDSNADLKYTRNRVRHQLLPLLRTQYQPNVDQALLRLAASARTAQQLQDRLARQWEQQLVEYENPLHARLHLHRFEEDSPAVITALFQRIWRRQHWPLGEMTHSHWRRLIDLLGDPGAAADFPGKIRATRRGTILIITRQA